MSSDPASKSICRYYFDDIVSNNVENGTTYQYDLSLVNVGTATPTISRVFNTVNAVSNVPTLYQNTGSSTSYSYYVNNTNYGINSIIGSFSVSFWCYVNSTFTATKGVVWCLYNDISGNLITFTQSSNIGVFIISITLNGVRFYIGNSAAYTTNAYHHFVLTCSTSGTTSSIQLYVDGSIVNFGGGDRSGNTANVTCTVDTPTITASALLFNGLNTTLYVLGGQSELGIAWPAASTSISNGFNGYLSQLTIYNAALTSAEVTFLRNNIYVTTPQPLPTPWGSYIAGHPSNTSTSLFDITGNGRNATIQGTATLTTGTGFGATNNVPYLTGTTATKINWPTGSIPSGHTILSVTSYLNVSSINRRILVGKTGNWLHGHHGGNTGVLFYDTIGFLTAGGSGQSPNALKYNWVVACGTNNPTRTAPNNAMINGVANGVFNNVSQTYTSSLCINDNATYSGETSDFAFYKLIIWNQYLTVDQMFLASQQALSELFTPTPVYNINNTRLIQYYPFNPTSLNSVYNIGVTTVTATDSSNVSYSTITAANTRLGIGSVFFGASNVTGFTLPSQTLGKNGITMAVWVKYESTTFSGLDQRIYEFTTASFSTTTFSYFSLYYSAANARLAVSFTSNGLNTNYTLTDTNWHHYCVTVSPTGSWNVYVDGSNVLSNTSISGFDNTTFTLCYIAGSHAARNYATGIRNAYMNQFLCLNRQITQTELSILVNYPQQVQFTSAISSSISYETPVYPCFLEGTRILRMNPETDEEEYIAVEKLRRGDLIKTLLNGYKAIHSIGHKILPNPATDKDKRNRLYRFSKQKCPDVNRDLYITGEHCTLRLDLTYDQVEQIKDHMGRYYITDKHFRCPACLDERADPYDREDKPVTIWHFALEHYDAYLNYGVYANGLLVESCSIEYLVKKSNMVLI